METIFRAHIAYSEAQRSDRSAGDRLRHRQKVRESIRDNIADIIAEESIIGQRPGPSDQGSDPRRQGVPVRLWRQCSAASARAATATSEPGQVVGTGKDGGPGRGQAGDQAGVDYYETEVTLDELDRDHVRGSRASRPRAQARCARCEWSASSKRKGYPQGGHPRSARQATHRPRSSRASKRKKARPSAAADSVPPSTARSRVPLPQGRSQLPPRSSNDPREESNAVVLCIMDTSGSMDTMKKYLARSFFFLLYQFICTQYRNVEIVFIAHHTEAREVTEEEFFHKGESGGTFISSGYTEGARDHLGALSPGLWNVYAFHCSDGDNFESDNPAALTRRQRSWPRSATSSATARSSRSVPRYYGAA